MVTSVKNRAEVDLQRSILFGGPDDFLMDYTFQLPVDTRSLRSDYPFKIVKKEYLIMTWMTLVGNVGGTLGMFIGFSFLNSTEWIIVWLAKIWRYMQKAVQKEETQLKKSQP